VASGPAIAAAAAERGQTWSTREVFDAAAAGDPVGREIATAVGVHLGRAIRALVLTYGVDRVILGGGVSRAGRPLLDAILARLERERAESALVRHAIGPDTVRLLPPDVDAGGWGAVTVARLGLANGQHQQNAVAVGKEGPDP
jgi:predicted NBD/HSP70 family sugar kinase